MHTEEGILKEGPLFLQALPVPLTAVADGMTVAGEKTLDQKICSTVCQSNQARKERNMYSLELTHHNPDQISYFLTSSKGLSGV